MTSNRLHTFFPTVLGYGAILFLVLTLVTWGTRTKIAGSVVTSGTVQVENNPQVIQHQEGGVVGEILVRDGDHILAGEVLIQLDGTFLRSELAIVEGQMAQNFAHIARLRAERDDAMTPNFSIPLILAHVDQKDLDTHAKSQRDLYEIRNTSLRRKTSQINARQAQIEQKISGALAQIHANESQLILVKQEIHAVEQLFRRNLVEAGRLRALQREQARLDGDTGRLLALIAEERLQASVLTMETEKLWDDRREGAMIQLRELMAANSELRERRLALMERLSRLDIRAPVSGVVFDSQVFAAKSVIRPAAPIMHIVPNNKPLEVIARISPNDVDRIYRSQPATLKIGALGRSTPDLKAQVIRISADATWDETRRQSYFDAVLAIDPDTLNTQTRQAVIPGMPVTVFLKTDMRTPLTYLIRPISTYFDRAFRED